METQVSTTAQVIMIFIIISTIVSICNIRAASYTNTDDKCYDYDGDGDDGDHDDTDVHDDKDDKNDKDDYGL